MRLTRLEIFGFKSFTNKTEIMFPKNITGIVGPNGSGKSNIADAVRWVLGEQNARILRGGKMEDVIFNGTQKKKPMGYCEVSLVFDNDDKILHPDFLEVMVTRRVFRNGDSEYEINKQPCRLKDIVEMFSDTGIGKEGYSIIGQGRIDEILSRKTEDRRAVFEEAAGITYYKLKKHEADLRLSRTHENLIRINDIVKEQEKLLAPLKIQAENAKKYLNLNQKLKEISAALFVIDYDRLNLHKENAIASLNEISDLLATYEYEIAEHMSNIVETQNNISKLETNCSSAAEQTILADRKLSALREESASLLAKYESSNHNLTRLQAEMLRLNETKHNLETAKNKDTGDKEQALENLNKLVVQLRASEKAFDEAETKNNELSQEHELLKNKLIDNMSLLSKSESGRSRQIAIKEQMQVRISDLQISYEKLKVAFKNSFEVFNKKSDDLDRQKTILNNITTKLNVVNKNFENTIMAIKEKDHELRYLNQDLSSKTAKYKTMQDMAKDFEGYAHSVKFAMSEAKAMSGVYGTLASIINSPQKYEVALDMVLGGALQNIITQSDNEAKVLIDKLREKQAGRATFLPISSVFSNTLHNSEREYLKQNGCLGVASELISYDSKFKGVVENQLGRTLIIDDLQSGINIRKAGCKLRMVTLRGDVMHSGGSMTGGSIKSNSSGFLARERMLYELKQEIETIEIKLEQSVNEYRELKAKREEVELSRQMLEQNQHEQEIALARLNDQITSLKEDVDIYSEQENELLVAIEQLSISIEEIDLELESLNKQSGEVMLNTNEMSLAIEKLAIELQKHNEIVDNLRNCLTETKIKHSDSEHVYNQYLRDENRIKQSIEEHAKLIDTANNEITSIQHSIESINSLLNINAKSQKKSKENFEELNNNQKLLESQRLDNTKNLRMLQEEENNIRQAQIKALDKQHKLELNLQSLQSEQKIISDSIWNKFELSYANAEVYRPDSSFDFKKAQEEQENISQEIRLLGTVNVNAMEEYNDLKARNNELVVQKDDIEKSIEDLNTLIKKLLKNMEKQFIESFEALKSYFSETFSRLFDGGQGEIILLDPSNALECGIDIVIQPPGKKKQLLSLFSGGERALTAIALIFAMLKLRPSPFCLFDEIEAALDDANINNFADYLREFSSKTQFIVVTHRKGTMERCDSLYGVAMAEQGVSSMLSIDLSNYEQIN